MDCVLPSLTISQLLPPTHCVLSVKSVLNGSIFAPQLSLGWWSPWREYLCLPLAISMNRTGSLSILIFNSLFMAGSMEYMEVKGHIIWSREDVYKWKHLRPTEKQQKKKYVNTVLRIKINWSWANIGLIDLITLRALLLDSGRHRCQVQTHRCHPALSLLLFLHFLRKNPKCRPLYKPNGEGSDMYWESQICSNLFSWSSKDVHWHSPQALFPRSWS